MSSVTGRVRCDAVNICSYNLTPLMLKLEQPGKPDGYHGCSCTGFLRLQVINSYGIEYIGKMGPCLPQLSGTSQRPGMMENVTSLLSVIVGHDRGTYEMHHILMQISLSDIENFDPFLRNEII